ncbi:hypothetical protein [Paenibacillus taichungensis]|uniref:hypothetical protein n=1 Tax=Paenibacillus taichungensis TaxID=484184 RepID=UPI0035D819FF
MEKITNQNVTLYHGTTSKRAQSILSEGQIRIDADLIYPSEDFILGMDTTPGYIYMTDTVAKAIMFGNKSQIIEDETQFEFYIFELQVEVDRLEADLDEARIQSLFDKSLLEIDQYDWEGSLKRLETVRTADNLHVGTHIVRYAVLPTMMNGMHPLHKVTQLAIHQRPGAEGFNSFLKDVPWKDVIRADATGSKAAKTAT